jgi:bisphosphoglycerate-independent phosphoglycerate mutase (AlkP superfamily)
VRLGNLTGLYDFVLFEYYYTDHAGHSQSATEAVEIIKMLDQLIDGILTAIDVTNTLLVVTSDHGNMEDLSTKSHTRNPVPLIAAGAGHRAFATGLTDLTHVAPAILNYLI